jgi:signal transduction histidine kinase
MRLMRKPIRHWALGLALWLAASVIGSVVVARNEISRMRDAFDTDARIAHRLLSQRAVQHDAVLATLALLQPPDSASPAERRLPSVYPQILGVERRSRGQVWPDPRMQAAEAASKDQRRAVLAHTDLPNARYQLVLAGEPASFALQMDLRAMVPWNEWPMARETSAVRVTLEHEGSSFVVQPGRMREGGWRFDFHKHLAADSQPFDMVATRQVGWAELPWGAMALWTLAAGTVAAGLMALLRQRVARQRAEELLRLGQVGRLNALGELAAGMAHELNQPLTAVLANSQAARRLLDDDPPDVATARTAMGQAAEQARRAADVVGRLRRAVERPDISARTQPLGLAQAVQNVLYLLEPELNRSLVAPHIIEHEPNATVQAEPVAVEQIIYNLLTNALHALQQVPAGERELAVEISRDANAGVITVSDSGPGIPADVLPRLFEPFFSTRGEGLGLGLSLCESLAQGMGGGVTASQRHPRGAKFRLTLPLAISSMPA